MLQSQSEDDQNLHRAALLELFESLRFLTQQGLATRGHTDVTSDYHQLLKLRAKDSPVLSKWLASDSNNKWLSHDIETEMIACLSHSVLMDLTNDIRKHDFFCFDS